MWLKNFPNQFLPKGFFIGNSCVSNIIICLLFVVRPIILICLCLTSVFFFCKYLDTRSQINDITDACVFLKHFFNKPFDAKKPQMQVHSFTHYLNIFFIIFLNSFTVTRAITGYQQVYIDNKWLSWLLCIHNQFSGIICTISWNKVNC